MQQLKHAFYQARIQEFIASSENTILGILAKNNLYELTQEQRTAWLAEIDLLKNNLVGVSGFIFLEYSIPRMGKRADAILLVGSGIFVIEFKVGSSAFEQYAIDQVMDYALVLLLAFPEPAKPWLALTLRTLCKTHITTSTLFFFLVMGL